MQADEHGEYNLIFGTVKEVCALIDAILDGSLHVKLPNNVYPINGYQFANMHLKSYS